MQIVVFVLDYSQFFFIQLERKWRGAQKLFAILDQTLSTIADDGRSGKQQNQKHQEGRQCITQVLAVLSEVDGGLERNGFDFLRLLIDARQDQLFVVSLIRLLIELEDIEQFVFDIGEMFPNDGGCFFVADDPPQVKIAQEGIDNPIA